MQGAKDVAGVVAHHAIKDGRAGTLLDEAGNFVGSDAEALPVDDGAGCVGDGQCVANGGHVGLAINNNTPHGVSNGLRRTKGNQQRSTDWFELKGGWCLVGVFLTHSITRICNLA